MRQRPKSAKHCRAFVLDAYHYSRPTAWLTAAELQALIRARGRCGWSDTMIADVAGCSVGRVRRHRVALGLSAVRWSEAIAQRHRRAARSWQAAQGFASLAAVRRAVYGLAAIREGWPPMATPRQVSLLTELRAGPRTMRELAEAIGLRPTRRLGAMLRVICKLGWVQAGWRRRTPRSGSGGKERSFRLADDVLLVRQRWEATCGSVA